MDEVAPAGIKRSNKHIGTVKTPIQSFEGSTRTKENPIVSLLENTYSTIREADRNEVLRSFIDVLTNERGMYDGDTKPLAAIGRQVKAGEEGAIQVFRDGKVEHWQFQPELHKTMKGIDADDFGIWIQIGTAIPQLMKNAITHAPDFMVRNAMRDTVTRAILSDHGSKPWDILRGMSKAEVSELKRGGGGQSGLYLTDRASYHKEVKKRMRELTREGSIISWPWKVVQGYGKLAKDSEMLGRVAEYRRAKEYASKTLGYDDYNSMLYAANQARGLLDFAQVGSVVRTFNRFVPFTNAAIQSLRRTAQSGRKAPASLIARMVMFTLPMSLASWAWNAMDDETEREYWQLPAYQRDLFWNFKVGGTWWRIPKPFELGLLSSGVERAIAKTRGDEHAFEGYGGSVAKSLLPVDESAIAGPLSPVMQSMANRDFFRDRYIVPPHEADLSIDRRGGTDNASRLGELIQRITGDNLDARKADFLVEQQLGGIGKIATRVSDIGEKGTGKMLMQTTGINSPSPTTTARDVQKVMDYSKKQGDLQNPLVLELRAKLSNARSGEDPKAAQDARHFATKVRKVYEGEMTPEQAIVGIDNPKLAAQVKNHKFKSATEYRLSHAYGKNLATEFASLSAEEKTKYNDLVAERIIDDPEMKPADQDKLMADYGVKPPVDLALLREYAAIKRKDDHDAQVMKNIRDLQSRRNNTKDETAKAELHKELVEASQKARGSMQMTGRDEGRLKALNIYRDTKAANDRLLASKTITKEEYEKRMKSMRNRVSGP
jgi:hypothetical protein